MSNRICLAGPSLPSRSVESTVENPVLSTGKLPNPRVCGKCPGFPPGIPRVLHTNLESSSLRALTFRSNEGEEARLSSTFLME